MSKLLRKANMIRSKVKSRFSEKKIIEKIIEIIMKNSEFSVLMLTY